MSDNYKAADYLSPHTHKRYAPARKLDVERLPKYHTPKFRSECPGVRPCPYVSCKYHLYLDADEDGTLKINFPTLDPSTPNESCALDIAERGGCSAAVVGTFMNLSPERVRQIEKLAIASLENKDIE